MEAAPTQSDMRLGVGQCATLACLLEVNAPKVGNVHRGADFDDATLNDFAASAVAIGPILEQAAASSGVGDVVLRCVEATQRVSPTNTNLGTILLLAPMACASPEAPLRNSVAETLGTLTPDDAEKVYQAIRLAKPGGLGDEDVMDVRCAAPSSLLDAMQASASRDMIAAQYVTQFSCVFDEVVPRILSGISAGLPLPMAIVHTQLQLLAEHGDSLIARKCDEKVSQQCAARAARVLSAGEPLSENYHAALSDFDFWLRTEGRRRNPGTTADLIAAGLFVCLRERRIAPPFG